MRYTVPMNVNWKFLKNPWAVFGGVFSLVVLFGLILFSVQVVRYIGQIRLGAPNPFEAKSAEKKAQLLFRQPVLADDVRSQVEAEEGNPMLGNPEAPIRLVEFLDYECPFCQRSAPDVRAFLARHPNDVLLIIRDFPLESVHANAMGAAIAARCILAHEGANTYWRYHDILYRDQLNLSPEMLRASAEMVGADAILFQKCTDAREPEESIRASLALGASLNLRGTPTFFWNGTPIPGAIDLATLEAMFAMSK